MVGVTFWGNVDLASLSIWAFWFFFAGLIIYIQRENMREGYPLVDDDGKDTGISGWPLPEPKILNLPHDRGQTIVPSAENERAHDRTDLKLARTAVHGGAPYEPTGDPMVDGVGPASWVPRRDAPELDAHGHPKIKPMSALPAFAVTAGNDPRGKPVVSYDGEVVGRITDMMVDIPEALVRYLVMDLNPEGTGQTRLIPINLCRIKSDRVYVQSLYAANFAGIPTAKSPDEVTLLEEEKVMAYFAGGKLYADPSRLGPKL
ncbi:photosynthetic reaction center subunit H [Histidinibacterium aquaticum]|uniref:Photosynthetic reaction center subunit H n=1 Tax=Histidinibacterium aquaticum TaxID=2613962 RepID=A0A5J5GFM0_9RHOB|nr:photosynthetic reaction center subunit H [Histidinibacterium aquaticum]KAA9006877.1 photosynthetic reaction center subunit H [Histidinibacterium aquaticum]